MSKKYGIEKLKKVVRFGMNLHVGFIKAMKDGKITFTDIPHIIDPMKSLIPAIGAAPESLKEVLDLDEAEKKELFEWARTTYDIPNDDLEVKIESCFKVIIEIAYLVGSLKKPETKKKK